MKPKRVKKLLMSGIRTVADNSDEFCVHPGRNFTRNRKLPFEKVIKTVLGMESKGLTNELINEFDSTPDMPSASAFVQQRCKIKPEAFKAIFDEFTSKLIDETSGAVRILAVDGSDLQIATNPDDLDSYQPRSDGGKPHNLIHLNALYDLKQNIYMDVVVQGRNKMNEHSALQEMVDRSAIPKALVVADRGYESYNNMAHIQEKGWYFLIRIKDGKHGIKAGLELPESDEFDEKISLKLTRKQTNEVKALLEDRNHYRFIATNTPFDYLKKKSRKHEPTEFYELGFRIVRFKVTDGLYETVLTNLDENEYTAGKLRELYAARWGIETSFRN